MLTVYTYRTQDPQLRTLAGIEPNCWVNLVDPLPTEINRVSEELGIPIDYLTYPLDLDEQARIEAEEMVQFIILRTPYYEGETADVPYITVPLGIVLTEQAIVTISKPPNDIMAEFISGRIKTWSTGKRNRFVLQILLHTAQQYLLHLRAINKAIDAVEDQL
jgi:magnesium transporter